MARIKFKKNYTNLLILIVSIIFSVLVLEFFLGFYKFDQLDIPQLRTTNNNFFINFKPEPWEPVCDHYKIPLLKEDSIRIIVIGESSVLLFCSFDKLESLLEDKYSNNFEIINFGVPSTTTNTMKNVIDKAVSYEPDYIIFYFGNNEYIQFSENSKWFLDDSFSERSNIVEFVLSRLHTIQMKVIKKDNMRRLIEWRFKRNLQEMIDKVKETDIELVIAKIASNTIDPPFRSEKFDASANIGTLNNYPKFAGTNGWLKRFDSYNEKIIMLKSGLEELELGNINQSIKIFKQLRSKIGKKDPFMEYYLAQIYYHLKDFKKAKLHFQNAIDLDDMPFRVTTGLNKIIEEVAIKNDIKLIDVYSRIEKESLNNIIGYDLFIDHVHLNNKGMEFAQEELAKGLAELI